MASLSDIVNVTVSTLTAGVKQPGFGIPLIADYHNRFPERVRHYSDLDGLLNDGFLATDPAYRAASAAFAQDPQVSELCIGRRALAPALETELTVTFAAGKTYSVAVTLPNGTTSTVTYTATSDRSLGFDSQTVDFGIGDVITGSVSGATGTVVSQTDAGATGTLRLSNVVGTFDGADVLTSSGTGDGGATGADTAYESLATVVAGLTAGIEALTGVGAVNASPIVRVSATTPGDYFACAVGDKAILSARQTHADPGIATDLAAMKLEDDTWYGLTITTQGALEIAAAATWAEANDRLMIQASQDGDIIVTGAGDVASTLKTANQFRTALIFAGDPTQHAGAAWLGKGFPIDPGGLTFANLTLASVDTEELTGSNVTQLKAKNCNYMTDYGGRALTRNGVTAAGEFIDIIRDRDWYESQLQTFCLDVMINNLKVPMTDVGIGKLEAAVRAATKIAIDAGFLAEGSDQYVVPVASSISPADRAARTLGATPIKVRARVAGAIHVAEVRATITA